MIQMEHLIKKSVKGSFQRILQKYTTNKRTSWIVWIIMTWITQSSSLVSLLVVVFVWAWLFTIQSGIAMVVWANIGTTFSSLLIALVWFGKRSISAIALPLIAVWGLGSIFLPRVTWKRIAWILVSLGLIFLGIDFLKDAVWWLSAWIDLVQYEWFGIIWFFVVWIVITTVIQSSHTVVILALTALYSWLLSPAMALGIVIGSNIGTTTTVLIASLGGSYTKRQVAFSHLGFNIVLSVIWLLLWKPLYWIAQWLVWSTENITISIAVFNTLLNTATTLIIMPFLSQFMRYISTIFPNTTTQKRLKTMTMTDTEINTWSVSQTVITLLEWDLELLRDKVMEYVVVLFGLDPHTFELLNTTDNESHKKLYFLIYDGLTHCDSLVQWITNQELNKKQQSKLIILEERIDTLFWLLEWAKTLVQPVVHITEVDSKIMQQWHFDVVRRLQKTLRKYYTGKWISQKQLKKIPHLSFVQLNTKEINHYDIVRIDDYLKQLFTTI